MPIDEQKFIKLCEDVAVIKAHTETTVTHSVDINKRVTKLEQKWWTIHGAWLVISGAAVALKDKFL